MKRSTRPVAKKAPEGRKKKSAEKTPRGAKSTPSTRSSRTRSAASSSHASHAGAGSSAEPATGRAAKPPGRADYRADDEACRHCAKDLSGDQRALFVEEELGRVFCSEDCIAAYFSPDIERLEREFQRRLSSSDLSTQERESLNHLRWITLQEPDEVWREKTLAGDLRYTLISQFQPGNRKVWCVCICLFLRGEPSFLYLAFPTRNAAMVSQYRRGERVEWPKTEAVAATVNSDGLAGVSAGGRAGLAEIYEQTLSDRLAEPWTEEETLRARITSERSEDDIPAEEFSLYQSCLEETLESPDELWILATEAEKAAALKPGAQATADSQETQDAPDAADATENHDHAEVRIYHFIRYYPDEKPGVWYIVVARETEDEEQIEILDAFPTRDAALVDRYRRGEQEIGNTEIPANRVIH